MKENSIGDRIEEKYTRYLNCETDTLELTIEEAIFILETDASLHYVEDLLQEAYKVILSDYKRVLKENAELKNKLKEKDKIIDLMAIAISNEPLPTEEYCIFRNFDCPEVGGKRDCKECVKQYFERKVENGN